MNAANPARTEEIPASAPDEGTTRSGRRVILSQRRAEAEQDRQVKEAATAKKAKESALRARQAEEEANDFRGDSIGPESEEEYADETVAKLGSTKQFTVTHSTADEHPARPRLIRRARPRVTDENDPAELQETLVPAKPKKRSSELVRRAGQIPPLVVSEDSDCRHVQTPPPKKKSIELTRRAGHVPPATAVLPPRVPTDRQLTGTAPKQTPLRVSIVPAHQPTPRLSHHQLADLQPAFGPLDDNSGTGDELEHVSHFSDDGHSDTPGHSASPAPASAKARPRPASLSVETTHIVKKQRIIHGSGSRGRLTTGDFEPFEAGLLAISNLVYRSLISTDWPFPDNEESTTYCSLAWDKACKVKKVDATFDDNIIQMITPRASQMRGEVKAKARLLVPALYGLQGKSSEAIRTTVEGLLSSAAFTFKQPDMRGGAYKHPIIQATINETWFANKRDEGVAFPEYFETDLHMGSRYVGRAGRGIPLVAIALVLAAVECSLEEWSTGQRSDIKFTEDGYLKVFEKHLKDIEKFDKNTADMKIIPRIQAKLLKRARAFAKAPDEDEVQESMGQDDYAAARKEWEANRSGGESD